MKTFTFSLMEQIQRADGALQIERAKASPDGLRLVRLGRLRQQLAARLKRSFASSAFMPMTAGA